MRRFMCLKQNLELDDCFSSIELLRKTEVDLPRLFFVYIRRSELLRTENT